MYDFMTDQSAFSGIQSHSRESTVGDCEGKMSDNARRKIDGTETDRFDTVDDSGTAGQAGDTQGLSDLEDVDNESVEELVEEGQGVEAAAVEGVEDAPDPDVSEVRTREVPEDDVPEEYRDDSNLDVA